MEMVFVFPILAAVAQFITIRLTTQDEWFPKMPTIRAALSQGAIVFLLTIFVGTVLSSGLWLLVFIIPGVFQGIEGAISTGNDLAAADIKRGSLLSLLISLTPYLYLILRMVGQVRTRRAREAWQASAKRPTL